MTFWLVDPLVRRWPTYPPNRERRRMAVFGWRVTGAHVHHVVPISAGGRHGLASLRLLCARCHCAAHPGTGALREAFW